MPSFVNAAASVTVGLLVGAAVFYGVSGVDTDNLVEDYPSTVAAPSEPTSSGSAEFRDDAHRVEPEPSRTRLPAMTTGTPDTVDTVGQPPVADDASPVAEPYTFTPPPVLPGDVNYRADRPRVTDRSSPGDNDGLLACTLDALGEADPLDPGYVVNQLIRRCLTFFNA